MDIKVVKDTPRIAIDKLKPYENNARLNDNAVPALMKSIEKFGFVVPIVITSDNEIVCGHTRVKAAKKLGMKEVPCVFVEGLTETEIKALRLADNKVAEIATWDMESLNSELSEIGNEIDMSDFGFDLGIECEKEEEEELSGECEELQEGYTPISKRGEVYQLGRHRLMCGDSTNDMDWVLLMDGEKGNMVFTDPPYGVAIGTKNKALNKIKKQHCRIEENIKGDEKTPAQLKDEILVPAFRNLYSNLKDDACWFVASAQGVELMTVAIDAMSEANAPAKHVIIWKKNGPTFSIGRLDYDYQHEPILYGWGKSHRNYRHGDIRTSIWEFDKPNKSKLHPTMKPVALVKNAILDGSEEGMLVLDAFGGSGTTLIAAEESNRRACLMELDPHYCDVIRKRYAEMVGNGENWIEATPVIRRQ